MKTISKSLETAFSFYKKNSWSYIKGMLVIFGILFLTTFMSLFILFGDQTFNVLGMLMSDTVDSKLLLSGIDPLPILLTTIFASLGIAASYACVAGIIEYTANLSRSRKTKIIAVMNSAVRRRGLTLVVAKVLTSAFLVVAFGLSLLVGAVLSLVIPSDYALGIIFYTLLLTALLIMGVLFSVVDQSVVLEKVRPFTALTRSYSFARKNFLDLLIFTLFFLVVSNILTMIPVVGFLVSFFVLTPISIATYTYFYIKNK